MFSFENSLDKISTQLFIFVPIAKGQAPFQLEIVRYS